MTAAPDPPTQSACAVDVPGLSPPDVDVNSAGQYVEQLKFVGQGPGVIPRPEMPEIGQLLRSASLRITQPRIAVFQAVRDRPHADTETITGMAREHLSSVSHQTVYDVLHALTEAGLLRRFQPAGSLARYEVRVGDNHHHLVCRTCGSIADVDCHVGQAPCLKPEDDAGFSVDEAEVTFWGQCSDCATSHNRLIENLPTTPGHQENRGTS